MSNLENNGVYPVRPLPMEELEKVNMSSEKTDFSQYLVEKRKQLGLKQWEVAKMVGMKVEMYRAYELGRRTPKAPRRLSMIKILESCEECNHNPNLNDLLDYIREVKKGSFTFIFTDEKSMEIATTVFDFIIKNIRLFYKL